MINQSITNNLEGGAQLLHRRQKQRQDRDEGQFACLEDYLVNVSVF